MPDALCLCVAAAAVGLSAWLIAEALSGRRMAQVAASNCEYVYAEEPARPAGPGKGEPAAGPVYRNVLARDGYATLDGVSTLYELFENSVREYPSNKCLGFRPQVDGKAQAYKWLTYTQVSEKVAAVASALVALGVSPKDRCGIFGSNSPEWMIAMQACNRQSLYCVPLYDSLGENAVEYIVKHSEASTVFVSSEKMPILVKALSALKEQMKTIIYWGAKDEGRETAIRDAGVAVHAFDDFLTMGKAKPAQPSPPRPEDLCTIMYTSGTTGDPKGVELSHAAVVGCVAGVRAFLRQVDFAVTQADSMLSYLPLAHIFDRSAEEVFMSVGASIGFFQGDVKKLVDDIAELRPTIFFGVPRVFDRIYTGVTNKVKESGGLKAFLFHWGFQRKAYMLSQGHGYRRAAPVFDRLVFNKIKARLGGRVRIICSGGAPLAPHTEEFLAVTMCCPVVQGYGLTETSAVSFIGVPDSPEHAGTVGIPMPSVSFRLEAVPEMDYDPAGVPPRGEVCIAGPPVFTGYHKEPSKTREALDGEGWFHTGDIGEITPSGALRIIDRKKNIFKLAQGEYIAVEKIEATYKKNSLVEQIWVYGNSFESTLVGVIVPTEAGIMAWAKEQGLDSSFAEVCRRPETAQHLLAQITSTGKEGKLKGFEAVKALHVESEHFSVENDLLTPTFKLKRPQLQKRYQSQIDAMYKSGAKN